MIKNTMLTIAMLLTSAFAQAETLEILRNDHLKGSNVVTIHQDVAKKLRARGEDPSDYQLDGISLEVKARRSRTTATLIIGRDSDSKNVKKASNDLLYDLDADFTYDNMNWDLTGVEGQPGERWQMRFNNDVKVNRLYAHISLRRERIRIPMNDRFFKGENTIGIRRELQRLGYDSSNMNLKRVILVGKTAAGKGQAELTVRNQSYGAQTIPQALAGFNFQSNQPASYARETWNVRGNTQGPWQIHLNGRFKVKAIVVVVQ